MAAAARTYIDFVPPHNLVEKTDKQTLVIDLSAAGFKKEHLRVQIDNYGTLRISGERQLEGNKWSRFRKEFHVPEGCNAGDIRAKFDKDGVLHIRMPKLSPAEEPKVAADARQTAAAADAEEEEKRQKDEEPKVAADARQTAAAADAEEEEKRQKEDDARKRLGQEEHTTEEEGGARGYGGRGEAVASLTTRPAYGLVRDRSKMVRALLLAVVLALLGAAGMYAKYRLMDPSAEAAPADDHTVGLSDY